MNRKLIYIGFLSFLFLVSCKKEYHYVFDLGTEVVYANNSEKDKEKSTTQFISILYSNLYQSTIPQSQLADLSELRLSIGDKQLADDLIINAYVHHPSVQLPDDASMRANIEQFVEDTYIRFYLRLPTPYEAGYLKETILSDPELGPDLIYTAFAESNEYKFY